jgi:uncharacterized membrane protein
LVRVSDLDTFLQPTDIKEGDIVTFTSAGTIKPANETKFGRPAFQTTIRLPDGKLKTATINKTSWRALAKVWGDETTAWVNHEARVTKVKQLVQGEMTDVIYFSPVSTSIPGVTTTPPTAITQA